MIDKSYETPADRAASVQLFAIHRGTKSAQCELLPVPSSHLNSVSVKPAAAQLGVRARRAQHRLSWLLKAPTGDKLAYVRFRLQRGDDRAADRNFAPLVQQWLSPEDLTVPAAMQAVQNGLIEALAMYRPNFYSGKITFVQPSKALHIFPRNPRSVWGRHAAEIEIHSTPGDHRTQLEEPFAAELANVVSRCIRAALRT